MRDARPPAPGPVYVGPSRRRRHRWLRLLLLVAVLKPRKNRSNVKKQQSKGVFSGRRRTDRATSKNAEITNPKSKPSVFRGGRGR